MRKGGGKAKGGGFERDVCRLLSEWVCKGLKLPTGTTIFWRSASSGARATQRQKKGVRVDLGGDIMAVHEAGYPFTNAFSVECKFYRGLPLTDLLQAKGELMKFWRQCLRDAKREGNKDALLIFKFNGSPIYVMNTEATSYHYGLCEDGFPLISMAYSWTKNPWMEGDHHKAMHIRELSRWLAEVRISDLQRDFHD